MSDLNAIQASLEGFTKHLEEISNDRFNELRRCSFFDPIPGEWLKQIAEQVRIRTFAAGTPLVSEDDGMDAFYVILYGSATVYYRQKIVGTLLSGECLGESMFFASGSVSRSATVIADGELIAAEMRRSDLDRLDRETKTYLDKALLHALFKKLQQANRRIEALLR